MLSDALRLIRTFHDLKQYQLAEQIGLSCSYLSEIEKGHKTPTLEVVEKYSKRFKIPVSSIMFFSEQLATEGQSSAKLGRAHGIIARKIINLLSFIEDRAS